MKSVIPLLAVGFISSITLCTPSECLWGQTEASDPAAPVINKPVETKEATTAQQGKAAIGEKKVETKPAATPNLALIEEFKELLNMLGDDDFELREQAEKKLAAFPPDTLITLTREAHDLDLEAKIRLARITEFAKKLQLQKRISDFVAGNESTPGEEIPLWNEFKRLYQKNPDHRQHFADMVTNKPDLFLINSEKDTIDSKLSQFCGEIIYGIESGQANKCKNRNSLKSLIFLSCLSKNNNPMLGNYVNSIISNNFQLHRNQTGNTVVPDNKDDKFILELLDQWIIQAESVPVYNRFHLGNNLKLPNTIELCHKIIAGNEMYYIFDALTGLAKLGDDSVIPHLVQALKDPRVIEKGRARVGESNKFTNVDVQVCDIALACLIKKTGQNFADYQLNAVQQHPNFYLGRGSIAFENQEKRKLAFDKWNAWAKTNLNEKNELLRKKNDATNKTAPPDEEKIDPNDIKFEISVPGRQIP